MSERSEPHRHFMWLWWRLTFPGGWTGYRRISTGQEAWFQRFIEAYWILTGRWSLTRAYQAALARARIMYGPQSGGIDIYAERDVRDILGRTHDLP